MCLFADCNIKKYPTLYYVIVLHWTVDTKQRTSQQKAFGFKILRCLYTSVYVYTWVIGFFLFIFISRLYLNKYFNPNVALHRSCFCLREKYEY